MLKLIIEDDEGKTTVVPLIRDEITIGRKEGNTIRLTERNVSRRHARLMRRNGEVFLEDLGSYNGIRVNGSRIQGQIGLAEGDRIQIGDYMLAVKQDQPAAQAPADPFDDMKTVPVEKAEAQALAAHLAQQPGPAAPPTPGAPEAAPTATPPPDAAASQQRHRDLIEEAAQSSSQTPAARMVVVSANYAGLECNLEKAAQVIGRTEDNDIVIDHRSVSKHHAKIVREGASYVIVDQGSSNGIFVNGEKYDRVELRSGDMVDLGHVRMRFVAAGETWVFDPATAVQTGPEGGKSNKGLIGIVALVLVVAAVVAILFGTGIIGGKKKADAPKDASDDGMSAPMVPDRPRGTPTDYKPIHDAISSRDWKTAIREADNLLLANSKDNEARQLRQKAIEEQKNEGHSTQFFNALRGGNWEQAVFEGSQVSSDSVYNGDVSKRLVEVKKKFKQQLVTEANRLHAARDCALLKEKARKMQTLDPAETAITELERSCRPRDAVAMNPMDPPPSMDMDPDDPPRVPPRRPRDRPRTMEPMDRPPPRDTGGPSADQLLKDAQAALLSNQFGRAMKLANQSIRKKWSARAWAVLGVAACRAGNKGQAKRAYKSLRGGQRGMLVTVCKSVGIALP